MAMLPEGTPEPAGRATIYQGREIRRTYMRSCTSYEAYFGNLRSDDHLVLEVGAGDTRFAEVVNNGGHVALAPHVIRVDYGYNQITPDYREGAVTADAQVLPFADDTFDCTLSLWMLCHLSQAEAAVSLQEMLRVTKPEHTLRLGPISRFDSSNHLTPAPQRTADYIRDRRGVLGTSALFVAKPADYNAWKDTDKVAFTTELSRYVSEHPLVWTPSQRGQILLDLLQCAEMGEPYSLRPPRYRHYQRP